MEVEAVFNELLEIFEANCPRPLDGEPEEVLAPFFEDTVAKLLRHGLIRWDTSVAYDEQRDFIRRCVAQLAAKSLQESSGKPAVSQADVVAAMTSLLPVWETDCPLPQIPVDELQRLVGSVDDPILNTAIADWIEIARARPGLRASSTLAGCTLMRLSVGRG